MVAMKVSVSKIVRCAHTATNEISTKIDDTTTSRTAIHLRATDLSVVVSVVVVKVRSDALDDVAAVSSQ